MKITSKVYKIRGRDAPTLFKLFREEPETLIKQMAKTRNIPSLKADGLLPGRVYVKDEAKLLYFLLSAMAIRKVEGKRWKLIIPSELPKSIIDYLNFVRDMDIALQEWEKEEKISKKVMKDIERIRRALKKGGDEFVYLTLLSESQANRPLVKKGADYIVISAAPESFGRYNVKIGANEYYLKMRVEGMGTIGDLGFNGVLKNTQIKSEEGNARSILIHHYLEDTVPFFTTPIGFIKINVSSNFKLNLAGEVHQPYGNNFYISVSKKSSTPHIRLELATTSTYRTIARKYNQKYKKPKEVLESVIKQTGQILCRAHFGKKYHVFLSYRAPSDIFKKMTGIDIPFSPIRAGEANPHNFALGPDGTVGLIGDFNTSKIVKMGKIPAYLGLDDFKVKVFPATKKEIEISALIDVVNLTDMIAQNRTILTAMKDLGFGNVPNIARKNLRLLNITESIAIRKLKKQGKTELGELYKDTNILLNQYVEERKKLKFVDLGFPPSIEKISVEYIKKKNIHLQKYGEYLELLLKKKEFNDIVNLDKEIEKYFKKEGIRQNVLLLTDLERKTKSPEKLAEIIVKIFADIEVLVNLVSIYIRVVENNYKIREVYLDTNLNVGGIRYVRDLQESKCTKETYKKIAEGYLEEWERLKLPKDSLVYKKLSKVLTGEL